jgi:hypothetical protein
VWSEAATALRKFDEAVLTSLDADGYPFSIRVDPRRYDAATGELHAIVPAEVRPVESPANLLAHYHDQKMWNIKMMAIKGRITREDAGWVFQSVSFDAPRRLAVLSFVKDARASAARYLERRHLDRPKVNWAQVKEIQRRAKA